MTQPLHVVIWDHPDEPPATDCTIVYWSKFFTPAHSHGEISLPRYVEDNDDKLKERFLAFVREVGESQIADKSIIEHLRVLPEFSYWWMTLFACKRWSTTSNIIEAVRLLALEDILKDTKPTKISFATERRAVKNIIREWCARSGVEFQSLPTPSSSTFYRAQPSVLIPRPVSAALVLAREVARRIRAPKRTPLLDNSVDVVLIDFFSRLDPTFMATGKYRSGFWNILTDTLDDAQHTSLFLHQFVAGSLTPNRQAASQFMDGLNSVSTTQQHFLLDARLSVGVTAKAILVYLRLLKARFRIRKIKHSFSPSGSQLDLWKLFKEEWLDSLSGSTAILHSLTISELHSVIERLPPCRRILYLMENQPWEMAFVQLWKHRRSEPLIGVPHSSIRYWDLRFFSDSGAHRAEPYARPPIPSVVAANGPGARKSLDKSGIPAEHIVEVEALAYLYLEEVRRTAGRHARSNASMRVLVLGDFLHYQNVALLTMLHNSLILTQQQLIVTVKPHPLCLIDQRDYPLLQFNIDTRPLSKQLSECDIVLAANGTSASAEAHQYGLPVITILNGETFNFSPLRGVLGAVFVDSPAHLAHALDRVVLNDHAQRADYFFVDTSLQRWKHLLSL